MNKNLKPSIEKPWLKYYDLEKLKKAKVQPNMFEYLVQCNMKDLGNYAFNYNGKRTTYEEFIDEVLKYQSCFIKRGINKGDSVAFLMMFTPLYAYMNYALFSIGANVNALDPTFPEEHILTRLKLSKAKHLVVLDVLYPKIKDILPLTDVENIIVVSPFQNAKNLKEVALKNLIIAKDLLSKSSIYRSEKSISLSKFSLLDDYDYVPYDCDENLTAVMGYSSGTTGGNPKMARFTQKSFNNQALQHIIANLGMDRGDLFLDPIPTFTMFGEYVMHTFLCKGLEFLLPVNPNFDAFANEFKTKPVNIVFGTPLHYEYLFNSLNNKDDLSKLKTIVCGSAKLNLEKEEKYNRILQELGSKAKITQGYGFTELLSVCTYNKPSAYKIGSVGIPLPFVTVGIFDGEKELSYNETGEICVNTPTMMEEYVNEEEKTKQMIRKHEDGLYWLHSGDLGHMDSDGHLYITGRLIRRLTKACGQNVHPDDIERIVTKNFEYCVEDCAGVGYKIDGESGEKLKLYIVFKDEFKNYSDELIEKINLSLKENLQPFMLPEEIEAIDSIPYTNRGKQDYNKLAMTAGKVKKL